MLETSIEYDKENNTGKIRIFSKLNYHWYTFNPLFTCIIANLKHFSNQGTEKFLATFFFLCQTFIVLMIITQNFLDVINKKSPEISDEYTRNWSTNL